MLFFFEKMAKKHFLVRKFLWQNKIILIFNLSNIWKIVTKKWKEKKKKKKKKSGFLAKKVPFFLPFLVIYVTTVPRVVSFHDFQAILASLTQNYFLVYHKNFWSLIKTSTYVQGFFSKFLMGGDSKFSVPVGPRRGRSRMGGGGTCEKNPTEAKTAHLMQN